MENCKCECFVSYLSLQIIGYIIDFSLSVHKHLSCIVLNILPVDFPKPVISCVLCKL